LAAPTATAPQQQQAAEPSSFAVAFEDAMEEWMQEQVRIEATEDMQIMNVFKAYERAKAPPNIDTPNGGRRLLENMIPAQRLYTDDRGDCGRRSSCSSTSVVHAHRYAGIQLSHPSSH
jgi:hypothetical protein